jgi:hypothetical protein
LTPSAVRKTEFAWLDRLFYSVDRAVMLVVGRHGASVALDTQVTTAILTMSLVLAAVELVEVCNRLAGAAILPSSTTVVDQWPDALIIAACAAVWLAVSFRCVFRGAREAIHRYYDEESARARRTHDYWCAFFFLSVYGLLPLILRIGNNP